MATTKRLLALVITFLCAFSFMLTGCSGEKAVEVANLTETGNEIAPYKYDPPITITACQMSYPNCIYPEGDDSDNNIWTRGFEQDLGIKLVWDFQVAASDAFAAKVNGALSTNTLPELMSVWTVLFFKIADAGKFAPLNDYYEKYTDPELKEIYKNKNSRALKTVTRDGKMLAMCNAVSENPFPAGGNNVCWYRQDWLDKLGLSLPNNMDEWWTLTEAVSKGMSTSKKEVFGFLLESSLESVTTIGNAYGAYSDIWIEDENGEIIRGDVSDNWITPLKKLREAYKKGVIDPEFVNFDRTEVGKSVTNGQIGIAPSGYQATDGCIEHVVAVDPNTRWVNEIMPSGIPGQDVKFQTGSRISTFIGMRDTSEHPEAACLVVSYMFRQLATGDPNFYNDGEHDTYRYVQGMIINDPDDRKVAYNELCEVINGEKDVEELSGMASSYYRSMKPWIEDKDPKGWSMYSIYSDQGSTKNVLEIVDRGMVYPDRLWGPELPYWKQFGSDLHSQRRTYFMQIICDVMGGTVEENFAAWKDYFYTAGGDKCTQEMNDWWKAEGREGF